MDALRLYLGSTKHKSRHHCTSKCEVFNPCSNEMYRIYYLIFSFKYVLLRSSRLQQCRPQWTERRELCNVYGELCRFGERSRKVWPYLVNGVVHLEQAGQQQVNLWEIKRNFIRS